MTRIILLISFLFSLAASFIPLLAPGITIRTKFSPSSPA